MRLSQYLSLAVALPLAAAIPLDPLKIFAPRATIEETTDTLLFVNTMPQFQAARNAQSPPTLDWTSDNCSSSPDNPLGFKFQSSCQRHDFGYRNYKKQNRFTEANRKKIDDNFLKDLTDYCGGVSDLLEGVCNSLAKVYYEAVREFGSKIKVRGLDGREVWVEVELDGE